MRRACGEPPATSRPYDPLGHLPLGLTPSGNASSGDAPSGCTGARREAGAWPEEEPAQQEEEEAAAAEEEAEEEAEAAAAAAAAAEAEAAAVAKEGPAAPLFLPPLFPVARLRLPADADEPGVDAGVRWLHPRRRAARPLLPPPEAGPGVARCWREGLAGAKSRSKSSSSDSLPSAGALGGGGGITSGRAAREGGGQAAAAVALLGV